MRLQPPTITRELLATFAAATGDTNPIHIDPEAARDAGLEDVIAHGMLSMAWLGRLVTTAHPQSELVDLTVRFTAVTPAGARPTFTCNASDATTYHLRGELDDGTVSVTGRAVVREARHNLGAQRDRREADRFA